jgi:uncharacterized cupredoxin-like copper-binding protein
MRPSQRARGTIGLVLSAILLTTACGGDDGGSTASKPSPGATPDVIVKNDDALKFDQKVYNAKAGTVTIELDNDPGQILHTLKMDGQKGLALQVQGRGKTDTGSITLKPGTYTIYCDVPTHRGAGMEAKLIVS